MPETRTRLPFTQTSNNIDKLHGRCLRISLAGFPIFRRGRGGVCVWGLEKASPTGHGPGEYGTWCHQMRAEMSADDQGILLPRYF